MSDGPNIFDYAKSELSQDAFFAWLLEWAEDKYAQPKYLDLHKCAEGLLKAFFRDYYTEYKSKKKIKDIEEFKSSKITSIDIDQQEKRIDLLLTIGSDKGIYYLLIEDKIDSIQHDEQLKRYREFWEQDKNKDKRTCYIYLKTGKVDEEEEKEVKKQKYSLFDLNKIYGLLKNYNPSSEIFRSYLLKLETAYCFKKFIAEVEFPNFRESDYKHDVWKNNCYYFYWKKKKFFYGKSSKYYLALDVWLDEGENECGRNLYFCLHIISDTKGHWIKKSEIKIDEAEGIKMFSQKSKGYTLKCGSVYDYYEKKVSFKTQKELNSLIKSEIENLFSDE